MTYYLYILYSKVAKERFIKSQKSRKLIERMVKGEMLTGILAQLVRVPHVRD
ncbi:hypothetical protein [Pedobacter suwonensis]|uniref:hypothetical protein n=1 Tax=Pedobacter suwonensis TaxID=332999 RepID=UPI0016484A8E|nr:hypothetical protein [Pedobacter suwonensis]